MTARVLDGRAFAADLRADLQRRASEARLRYGRAAGLAILRVGDAADAEVYTRSLLRAAEAVGLQARLVSLGNSITEGELRAALDALNDDDTIDGVLVQQPLPPHLSQRTVAEALDPRKDVDGISLRSAGNLFLRLPSFVPSTSAAVIEMLDRAGVAMRGRRVVIVGASNTVGKPLALLLLYRGAAVTVCHIATRDLASWTRQADVLVVAVGKRGLITGEMVRPGAAVIDVGINVRAEGGVVGDVAAESVAPVAGALSPVPGGVGQLTNLMLLAQTLRAQRLWASGDGVDDTDGTDGGIVGGTVDGVGVLGGGVDAG